MAGEEMVRMEAMGDQRTTAFEAERKRLARLAYRMTGSLTEAEDVVQDAWLRWVRVGGGIDSPPAYLTRIVTRLCLDRRRLARARRETYVGPWLPDPLVGSMEPEETVADDVTVTLMLALERLSPLERAAFLLHDVFDVPLSEVAVTLDREPAAVRQHVRVARPRFSIEPVHAERITRAFFVAARDGDVAALSALLARNVEIHTDGGGKVLAFRNAIHGIERALRLFAGQRRKASVLPTLLRVVTIDGLPGYVSLDRGGVLQTTALDIREDGIAAIYIVRNPDKLSHLTTERFFPEPLLPIPPAS
ncbi:RNA polymerase sigma factor SigJ [Teichococcus oryzae]|uniref:RNA polymerase sigma factor SigJ n=1 Tax=Teichococcus oryzae TaxID=1608942 RepID=A0A5B2TBL5_9PROT|nr:RNA polymerase sigma factor SigJ [Pseudoroseomonas oryzae]KAA2211569.1 RNA polymerase sigma factor SigJ [Pseudoroseomonas oryzae]